MLRRAAGSNAMVECSSKSAAASDIKECVLRTD
jgi:hypothetical protein